MTDTTTTDMNQIAEPKNRIVRCLKNMLMTQNCIMPSRLLSIKIPRLMRITEGHLQRSKIRKRPRRYSWLLKIQISKMS